jgi:hypothetical protein
MEKSGLVILSTLTLKVVADWGDERERPSQEESKSLKSQEGSISKAV